MVYPLEPNLNFGYEFLNSYILNYPVLFKVNDKMILGNLNLDWFSSTYINLFHFDIISVNFFYDDDYSHFEMNFKYFLILVHLVDDN